MSSAGTARVVSRRTSAVRRPGLPRGRTRAVVSSAGTARVVSRRLRRARRRPGLPRGRPRAVVSSAGTARVVSLRTSPRSPTTRPTSRSNAGSSELGGDRAGCVSSNLGGTTTSRSNAVRGALRTGCVPTVFRGSSSGYCPAFGHHFVYELIPPRLASGDERDRSVPIRRQVEVARSIRLLGGELELDGLVPGRRDPRLPLRID